MHPAPFRRRLLDPIWTGDGRECFLSKDADQTLSISNHTLAFDDSPGTVSDFAELANEAIDILRSQSPTQDATLLDALVLQVRLLDLDSRQAIPVCKVALQLCTLRLQEFPEDQDLLEKRRSVSVRYAEHLRLTDCFGITSHLELRQLITQLRPSCELPVWNHRGIGPKGREYLEASLVLGMVHREWYDAAIGTAQEEDFDAAEEISFNLPLNAVRAYARWLEGDDPQSAFATLEECLTYSSQRTDSEHGPIGLPRPIPFLQDATHLLMLGWRGAVKAQLGRADEALQDGQEAVNRLRSLLVDLDDEGNGDECSIWRMADQSLEPTHRIFPQLLVLLAATLGGIARFDEAHLMLDEVLSVTGMEEEGGTGLDQSTLKTALLIQADVLKRASRTKQAENFRERASAIARKGYYHRLTSL